MNGGTLTDPGIANLAIDLLCEGQQAAVLVYDGNDQLVYAGGQWQLLAPVPASALTPGTRLRDIVAALFDAGGEAGGHAPGQSHSLRENWIAEKIASLWRERVEHVEQKGPDRWLQYSKRRLPNGYGVCVVRDISEQKKREEQWKAVGDRMELAEQVLDRLPFPVSIKSGEMVYVAVNQSFCKLLGRLPEELIGRTAREVFEPAIARRIEAADRQIIRNGISVASPELLLGKDGEHVKAIVRKFRMGRPGRYQVVTAMEDVSGLGADGIELVERRGGRKLQLAQHGLALQDMRGRNVLVVTTEQEAADVLPQSLSTLGAEASVIGSAEELELFLSLAEESGVVVDLVLVLPDNSLLASCTVVTEAFQVPLVSLDRSRIRTGLPALVAEIFALDTADDRTGLVAQPEAGLLDVLVAEDNAVNQIVFSQILEGFGYRYRIAADGAEAVRLWQEHAPRLVLMDITLPEMNGFEACLRIREIEGSSGNPTPVIGVLPQPFDHDREQCFASGMDDVILKPISPEMLESVILTYMPHDVSERRKSGAEGRQVC